MSSLIDVIKKEYEKDEKTIPEKQKRISEIKTRKKALKPQTRSIIETKRMKRVSLWLDKETYETIKKLISILNNDPMARAYTNESVLIRSLIRKGLPHTLSDFQRMFPNLTIPEITKE